MREPKNKTKWTPEMEAFLRDNYHSLTNEQLAKALGLRLTNTRSKLIAMGLKRMEMEYWTEAQISFLRSKYRTIGDKELAAIMQERWPKKKGWTLKHIEKKRMYLGLKRTKKQLQAIKERNRQGGCWVVGNKKMWQTRGVAPVGQLKCWGKNNDLYVKLQGRYEKLHRVIWEQAHGPIPKGMNVVRKNPLGPMDDINNLELLTNAQLGVKNSTNRTPEEVREVRTLLKTLNNKIKSLTDEKQNKRSA